MIDLLFLLRYILGAILLGIGAYHDHKTRHAPNKLWTLMGAFGVMFLMIHIPWLYVLPVGIIIIAMLILHHLKQIGGADTKAILTTSLLMPTLIMDILLYACIIMIISYIPIYLKHHQIKEYKYPFLIPLWIGFIISFWLPII